MSADINSQWLETFKTNLRCGPFPAKTSNPQIEMLTGLVGLFIEYVLCKCPTALDNDVDSPNIQDTNTDMLGMWYNKIKCGEFFESDAQAWAVYAMAMNKLLSCCEDEVADNLAFRAVTDNTTLVEGDANDIITVNAATAKAVTVPLNSVVPIAVGTRIKIIRLGAGLVSVAPVSGSVTINSARSDKTIQSQYGSGLLTKTATDTWLFEADDDVASNVNLQTGTSYTPTLDDEVIDLTNGSAIAFTIPLNASVPFPIGKKLELHVGGAGAVTVGITGGGTLNSPGGLLASNARYSVIHLRKLATDTWRAVGTPALA